MSVARRVLCAVGALLISLSWSTPARAQDAICEGPSQVDLGRHQRQLYLDLLGRPPTIEEYEALQAKGAITEDDVRELMTREEFYARIRGYHRALFKSNIAASVYNNNDRRLLNSGAVGQPYELRGNPPRTLRGRNGIGCDHYIHQSQCNAQREDPHREPAQKQCYDAQGVPLPVSSDYDLAFYKCDALDLTNSAIDTCEDAIAAGVLDAKYLNFCDLRKPNQNLNVTRPYLCLPNPANTVTAANTQEVLDVNGRVIAFAHPTGAFRQLDHCGLDLSLNNGMKGAYATQYGCLQREGYELVSPPYWDVTGRTEVAVCAIQAQTREVNPWTLQTCNQARFATDRTCGCGVGMRRCEGPQVHTERVSAFNQEPELIADSVIRRDEPYFNILTTRRSFVNGTLTNFYKQEQGVGVFNVSTPAPKDALPDLAYADTATWKEITRDAHHSGVLTTPSFLMRFPTQRARVNHFYEALLCKTFSPPADATLPSAEDACNRENNLAKRCGCNYCHATLEPTGAHWGRYGERSALWLNPMAFPKFDPTCRDCALSGNTNCGGECTQYVMQAYDGDGAQSLGMLKTYLYRTPDEEQNIDEGPELLVERMMQTGDLERCTVRRVWEQFLGRPMTQLEREMYLDELAQDFAAGGHKFKELVLKVVSTDAYRRID